MKFLFWNVQRLGIKTPEKRGEIMEGVIAEAFKLHHAELAVLCEVSGSTSLGDAVISKQIHFYRRDAHARAAQLGYGSIDSRLEEVTLDKYIPPSFTQVFGHPTHRKGGNAFMKQSKRFVAYAGKSNEVHIYIYHANASSKAAFLVAWVIEALRIQHDGRFLLVGDLNCEPPAVRTELRLQKRDPDSFQFGEGGPTHNAKNGATKTYDYAIGGKGVLATVTKLEIKETVERITNDKSGENMSDHLPIIVEF